MAKIIRMSDKYKKIFWAAFSPLLAMITVWALFKQNKSVSIRDIVLTASRADPFGFLMAIVCSVLYIFFEGLAIRSILKGTGFRSKLKNGLLYSTADIYFSAITPSATGGQPACAYFMLRDGISGGVTTAVLLLNLMMYTLSLVALCIISFFIFPFSFLEFSISSKLLIIGGVTAQLLLTAFFLIILKNGNYIFELLKRIVLFLGRKKIIHNAKKLIARLNKAGADYTACSQLFAGNKTLLLEAFVWNFLQRLSQLLVSSLLYISIGGNPLLSPDIFALQCLITVGYNFVPIPGAIGVADYLMIDGFSGIMERNMAFQLEMLSRGMTFYICVSLSGLLTFIGYLIKRRRIK